MLYNLLSCHIQSFQKSKKRVWSYICCLSKMRVIHNLTSSRISTQIWHHYFPTGLFRPFSYVCWCSSLSHAQMYFQESDVRPECVTQMRCCGSAQWGPFSSWDDLSRHSAAVTHTELLKRRVLAIIHVNPSWHYREKELYNKISAHSVNISVAWWQNAAVQCQHGKETYVGKKATCK